jgi:hypothetical protein
MPVSIEAVGPTAQAASTATGKIVRRFNRCIVVFCLSAFDVEDIARQESASDAAALAHDIIHD